MVGGNLRKFRNLKPPFRGVAYFMRDDVLERSRSQTDPEGNRWAALAPSTIVKKQRMGYPMTILTATGDMWRSLRVVFTDKFAEITITAPYSIFHQEGTSKMPQRKILGINKKILDYATKIIRGYIRGRGR
jgi:phage gpG-like protein